MANKRALTIATATLLGIGSLQAAFMSINEMVDIYLLGRINGEYRSNLFNTTNNEVDDTIITVSPGIEINAGRNSRARLNLKFYEHIVRYSDVTRLNQENADLRVTGFYDTLPAKITAGFSFLQTASNTPGNLAAPATNANLVEREIYNMYASTEYTFTEKVYATGSATWTFTDYTNNNVFGGTFSDNYSIAFPVDVLYRVTEKYSLGLGYRFRYTDIDDTTVTRRSGYYDNFVSLSVRGELLPKVRVRANAGIQQRTAEDDRFGSDQLAFTFLSELMWTATPKLEVTGGFTQDFSASSTGNSSIIYRPYLKAEYSITEKIFADGGISYTMQDYRNVDQGNDTVRFNIGAAYRPNDYLRFSAGYVFTDNSTHNNARGRDYSDHRFNLQASVRY